MSVIEEWAAKIGEKAAELVRQLDEIRDLVKARPGATGKQICPNSCQAVHGKTGTWFHEQAGPDSRWLRCGVCNGQMYVTRN